LRIVDAKCSNCGALLKLDENLKKAYCQYCGSELIVEQAINEIRVDHSEDYKNLIFRAQDEFKVKNYLSSINLSKNALKLNPESFEAWHLILDNFLGISENPYSIPMMDEFKVFLNLKSKNISNYQTKIVEAGYTIYDSKSLEEIEKEFYIFIFLSSKLNEIYFGVKRAYALSDDFSQKLVLSKTISALYQKILVFPLIGIDGFNLQEKWAKRDFLSNWIQSLENDQLNDRDEIIQVMVPIRDVIVELVNAINVNKIRKPYLELLDLIKKKFKISYQVSALNFREKKNYQNPLSTSPIKADSESPYAQILLEKKYLAGEEFKFELLNPENINHQKKSFTTTLIVKWNVNTNDLVKLTIYNLNEDEFFSDKIYLNSKNSLLIPLSVKRKDIERKKDYILFTLVVVATYFENSNGTLEEVDYIEFDLFQPIKLNQL